MCLHDRDRKPLTPAWVHDIALSSNHLVIVEQPLYFNLGSLMTGADTPHIFLDWVPKDGTLVHVVPLDGSACMTFEAPPLFSFHTVNAFESEDGKMLHVDLSVYDNPDIINDLSLDRLRAVPGKEVSKCHLRRLSIPLQKPSPSTPSSPTPIAKIPAPTPLMKDEKSYGQFFEFPAINTAYSGKACRYVYGMTAVRPTNMGNALGKHDLSTGTCQVWYEPGGMPGEPQFIAAPGAQSEDDGVLVFPVMCADGSSALVVLDAKSMQEVARARLPYVIPYRFHGTFMQGTGTSAAAGSN